MHEHLKKKYSENSLSEIAEEMDDLNESSEFASPNTDKKEEHKESKYFTNHFIIGSELIRFESIYFHTPELSTYQCESPESLHLS